MPIPDMSALAGSKLSASGGAGSIHTATDGRDVLWNDPDGWEVDSPWLWFTGDAASNPRAGQTFGNPIPGSDLGAAGRIGAVAERCLQLTADKIAGMPWKTYRGRESIEPPSWLLDPQALARDGRRPFVGDVGVRLSNVDFWSQYLRSLILLGEGIAYTPRLRDENDEPTGPIIAPLYVLNPKFLEVIGGQWYAEDPYGDPEEQEIPGYSKIDSRELIVTRWIMRPGYKRGLGALQAHALDFVFAGDIRAYADNLVQRGVPNGYLKSSKPDLTREQADELKQKWMQAHGGNVKSIGVLNATTEFHPITIDPQSMQFTEMKKLSAWEICLIFGVPASKLGIDIGSSLTYSTLEQANSEYVQDSLMNIARKLEAAIDAVLAVGTSMKIAFSQLLRADTSARYQAYATGIGAGFLTVDEVRALEDLPPLPSTASPAPADLTAPTDEGIPE